MAAAGPKISIKAVGLNPNAIRAELDRATQNGESSVVVEGATGGHTVVVGKTKRNGLLEGLVGAGTGYIVGEGVTEGALNTMWSGEKQGKLETVLKVLDCLPEPKTVVLKFTQNMKTMNVSVPVCCPGNVKEDILSTPIKTDGLESAVYAVNNLVGDSNSSSAFAGPNTDPSSIAKDFHLDPSNLANLLSGTNPKRSPAATPSTAHLDAPTPKFPKSPLSTKSHLSTSSQKTADHKEALRSILHQSLVHGICEALNTYLNGTQKPSLGGFRKDKPVVVVFTPRLQRDITGNSCEVAAKLLSNLIADTVRGAWVGTVHKAAQDGFKAEGVTYPKGLQDEDSVNTVEAVAGKTGLLHMLATCGSTQELCKQMKDTFNLGVPPIVLNQPPGKGSGSGSISPRSLPPTSPTSSLGSPQARSAKKKNPAIEVTESGMDVRTPLSTRSKQGSTEPVFMMKVLRGSLHDAVEYDMQGVCEAMAAPVEIVSALKPTDPKMEPFLPKKGFTTSLAKVTQLLGETPQSYVQVVEYDAAAPAIVEQYRGPVNVEKGGFDEISKFKEFGEYKPLLWKCHKASADKKAEESDRSPSPSPKFGKQRATFPRESQSPSPSPSPLASAKKTSPEAGELTAAQVKQMFTEAQVPPEAYLVGKKELVFLKEEATVTLKAGVLRKKHQIVSVVQGFVAARASKRRVLGLKAAPIQRSMRCYLARKTAKMARIEAALQVLMNEHMESARVVEAEESQQRSTLRRELIEPLSSLYRRSLLLHQKEELLERMRVLDEELEERTSLHYVVQGGLERGRELDAIRKKNAEMTRRKVRTALVDHEQGERYRIEWDEHGIRRQLRECHKASTKDYRKALRRERKALERARRDFELQLILQAQATPHTYMPSRPSPTPAPAPALQYYHSAPYSPNREDFMSPPRF